MQTFVWSEQYLTGEAQIDAEHQGLVRLINELIELRARGGATPRMSLLLEQLGRYAIEHFSHEESLMRESGVDARHVVQHCMIHRNFERQVNQLREAGGSDSELDYVLRFLTSWLAYHILGVDQAMGRQIRRIRAGASAAEAWEAESRLDTGPAVASLIEALNALYAVVSERNELLSEVNQQLEDMVAERTRQLQEAQARVSAELAELQRQCQTVVGVGRAISLPVVMTQSSIEALDAHLTELFRLLDAQRPASEEERQLLEEETRQLLREMKLGLGGVAEIVRGADELLPRVRRRGED